MTNLFFASNGPKPEFILGDAINNDVLAVKNGEFCLQYDRPLPASGLTWGGLIDWWRTHMSFPEDTADETVGKSLHGRLRAWLHYDPEQPEAITPERLLFWTYCMRLSDQRDREPHTPPCSPRSTCTSTLEHAQSVGARTASWAVNAWTSFSCSQGLRESSWKSTASSTTPKATLPLHTCTQKWSPRTGPYGSRDTRCTNSAATNSGRGRLSVVVSAQRFSPPPIVITVACALVVK